MNKAEVKKLFGEHDWSKLDGEGWSNLLRNQPQFADKCDWGKLNIENWATLIAKQPEMIRFMPK